jgi:hypothetical protein
MRLPTADGELDIGLKLQHVSGCGVPGRQAIDKPKLQSPGGEGGAWRCSRSFLRSVSVLVVLLCIRASTKHPRDGSIGCTYVHVMSVRRQLNNLELTSQSDLNSSLVSEPS